MDNENKDTGVIDLSDVLTRFLKILRRFWILILLAAVAGAGLLAFRNYKSFTPYYEARARFSVTSGISADSIFQSYSYYNNAAAQQLAVTFPQIISTELMRDLMLQELDADYINGTVSAEAVAETNMFVLTVRSNSPQDAYDILNAVIDCYPQVAVFMVDDIRMDIRESPSVPENPVNSFSWKRSAAKGAAFGAASVLAVMAVASLFTNTVSSPKELREIVNLPILGSLPQITKKKRRSGKNDSFFITHDADYAESIRGLRVKTKRNLKNGAKVVMITSTLEGEGKSTLAVNLAMSLTLDGFKVVLVDADLRKQNLAQMLNASDKGIGLYDVLKNPDISPMDCIQNIPGTSLSFISGNRAENSHISFDREILFSFFSALRSKFDYVIVDTPPYSVVADTGVLCRYAEGIIYVVRQDYARRTAILDSIDSLAAKDAVFCGCVLNGVKGGIGHYGYGYGYGYGYKYGYGYRRHYGYGKKYGYGYTQSSMDSYPLQDSEPDAASSSSPDRSAGSSDSGADDEPS